MRIFGVMVTCNEAGRYLDAVLGWHSQVCDELFVYDDWSLDDTAAVARAHGAIVVSRGTDVPTFAEHEGRFRQAALDAFEQVCRPTEDDWVLAIDADEFLVCDDAELPLRAGLERAITDLEEEGHRATALEIHEVFDLDTEGRPLVRIDGFWGRIAGVRLYRWTPGARLPDRADGSCGSSPVPAVALRFYQSMGLMHVGYLDAGDRRNKYERYRLANHGHNRAHIESIVGLRTQEPWTGTVPDIRRGL